MQRLLVRFEGRVIQEVDLDPNQEYLAGRDDSCQILLKGKSGVSRQHFKLYFNGSQWQVDVLSKFGHINFQAQEVDSIVLENGNSFTLSPFEFQFVEIKPEVVEPPPTEEPPIENPPAPLEDLGNAELDIEPAPNNPPAVQNPPPVHDQDFMGDDEKTAVGISVGEPIITLFNKNNKEIGSFELREGSIWIAGRDESCEIKIPDKKASRKHFEISKTREGFVITDLGSSNGTLINGRKLSPNSTSIINSGDIITVASVNIQFAIKSAAVEQQLNNLPDVLFNQTVVAQPQPSYPDMMLEPQGQGFQISPKILAIAAIVLFIIYNLTSEVKDTGIDNSKSGVIQVDDKAVNKLTREQQQYVKETYAEALSLHQQGKYQLAADQLEKIHKLVPFYERSKELEQECRDALKIIEEAHEREAEEQHNRERKEEISKIVATCKTKVNANTSINDLNACLQRAIELDPENSEVVAMQKQVEAQDEAKRIAQNQKQEYDQRVKSGVEIFNKAERLRKNKEYANAVAAYEQFLKSSLPDPQNNRKIASEQLSTIRKTISQMVEDLLRQAKEATGREDFKQAITAINAARKANPSDDRINDVESQVLSSQKQKLLNIFQEAKFEESLGNAATMKEKCGKIKSMAFPGNDYYDKCVKILKKYGD